MTSKVVNIAKFETSNSIGYFFYIAPSTSTLLSSPSRPPPISAILLAIHPSPNPRCRDYRRRNGARRGMFAGWNRASSGGLASPACALEVTSPSCPSPDLICLLCLSLFLFLCIYFVLKTLSFMVCASSKQELEFGYTFNSNNKFQAQPNKRI
jgi:hypothetical protein